MDVLNLEQVNFIRKQVYLLKEIQWSVKKGQHWALLGLNGAGKSLLLQIITGNLWASSGQVQVFGETFGQTSIPEINKRIGWVSLALQVRLKNEVAEKIVLSGKFASIGLYQTYEEADLQVARELLATLDSSSLIGKKYPQLSQGERQIVLIARALMAKPELLILDEPCTGLDLFAREELLKKIEQLTRTPNAPTILLVTHHTEEILPFITHVALLRDGEFVQQGERANVLQPEILSDFYKQTVEVRPYGDQRYLVLPAEKNE